ncbi:glycosyltransferase [Paenibacillus dendritiformis]|uniref:glycosyltransferase n=1 Tax=Paenibacillus dendritiformis TaxID=130049 RepID=UPI00366683F0
MYTTKPLVSIIIRTCNRPMLLEQALESLNHQYYRNFEVIVVEDGSTSAELVINNFSDLKLFYYSTSKPVGRTTVANIGLRLTNGQLVNFLDDDDLFLPNHIEKLVGAYLENPEYDLFHSASLERQIVYTTFNPLKYIIKKEIKHAADITSTDILLYKNMFPIQSVLFKKELYNKYGGLDENLTLLEDWDLWIKYSYHGRFLPVYEITSIFHTPFNKKEKKIRENKHRNSVDIIFDKYSERYKYNRSNRLCFLVQKFRVYGLRHIIKSIVYKTLNIR